MEEQKKKKRKINFEANARYQKKACHRYGFILHRSNDADIVEALELATNKNGFIKDALRFYIQNKNI